MEEAREVEDVGPEEDAPGGTRAEGEAEKPLEWGFGAVPEPSGVANLGVGGGEDADEDGGGDESHGEAVEGRDGAEWDGSASAEEEEDEREREGRFARLRVDHQAVIGRWFNLSIERAFEFSR
ncbi:hypothetical protein F0562_027337 [Nyssa sinensis]|uniref:Uncharacterized protein n=1 Tax=Nyssa sinensis TaxID=561372 RepID=A0A5J5B354_9ASTE|nr:hypothetical protein F0562_027337 [Nyssa sinensis]